MNNNHYETNYAKQYQKKLSKKESSLHTIKVININNNNSININQITPAKNNLFKNIKLYEVTKKKII